MLSNLFYNTSINTGGLGAQPAAAPRMTPRSVETQMFNRPAYQRDRITGGQMAEMNRANQDRYRAEVMPLQTAFNRQWNEANQRQQMNSLQAANQYNNAFIDSVNQYGNSQFDMDRQQRQQGLQMLWPMLSQYMGM